MSASRPHVLLLPAVLAALIGAPERSPAAENQELPSFSTEEEILASMPVVLSAARLHQPLSEAPASITVIDRRTIEASGALEVAELLRLVPGFQVADANGNVFTVTYHGFATAWPNGMQVLVDGRSVYTPLFSIIDWNNLGVALEDVERIEVTRGSNSPAYGANSFRYTVNIVTRAPFEDRGLTAKVTQGGNDVRQKLLRYADTAGALDYRVTLAARSDDGFSGVDDYKDIRMFSFRGMADISARDALDIQFGLSGGPVGSWGEAGSITNPIREKDTRGSYGFVRWQRALSQTDDVYVQFYRNALDWDDGYQIDLGPAGAISYSLYSSEARRYDLEAQHTFQANDVWRIVWGAGLRLDQLSDDVVLGRPDVVSDASQRAFFNAEWRARPQVTVNAGAMIEYNDMIGLYASPRVAVNYQLSPHQTLRASTLRSARTPSLYEFYNSNDAKLTDGTIFDSRYHSDPGLGAESIRSHELGYLLSLPAYRSSLDVKVFREEMRDVISNVKVKPYRVKDPANPDPTKKYDDSYVWMDVGSMDFTGAEMQIKFDPARNTFVQVQYGYVRSEGRLLRAIEYNGALTYYDIDFDPGYTREVVPRHTVSALLGHTFARDIQASLAYYRITDMTWRGDGDPLDAYKRLDARLAKRFRLGRGGGEIALIAHNLLNDYVEFRQENVFGTRTFVQLNLHY